MNRHSGRRFDVRAWCCVALLALAGCNPSNPGSEPVAPRSAEDTKLLNDYARWAFEQHHIRQAKRADMSALYSPRPQPVAPADLRRMALQRYPALLDYNRDSICDDYDPRSREVVSGDGGRVLKRFGNRNEAAQDIYLKLSINFRYDDLGPSNCVVKSLQQAQRFLLLHAPASQETLSLQYHPEALDLILGIHSTVLKQLERGQQCGPASAAQHLHLYLLNSYLWREHVPLFVDYSRTNDLEKMVETMRHASDRWSFVANYAVEPERMAMGTGAHAKVVDIDGTELLKIMYVDQGSPAQRAGLKRGDELEAVPNEQGVLRFKVFHNKGAPELVTLKPEKLPVNGVPMVRVLEKQGHKVGYMLVTQFSEANIPNYVRAAESLRGDDIDDLIVDLRYNFGGNLAATRVLGSLISSSVHGQIFAYSRLAGPDSRMIVSRFAPTDEVLDPQRIVFITSENTASAAEQLIAAMKPYRKVNTVGKRTHGKPVWMQDYSVCGRSVLAVNALSQNALGDSVPMRGIVPDCEVDDDLNSEIGHANSPSVKAALSILNRGTCR